MICTSRQTSRQTDRQTDRFDFSSCVIGRPTSPKSMKRACGPSACHMDPHLRAASQPLMLKQRDVVLRSGSVPQPAQNDKRAAQDAQCPLGDGE